MGLGSHCQRNVAQCIFKGNQLTGRYYYAKDRFLVGGFQLNVSSKKKLIDASGNRNLSNLLDRYYTSRRSVEILNQRSMCSEPTTGNCKEEVSIFSGTSKIRVNAPSVPSRNILRCHSGSLVAYSKNTAEIRTEDRTARIPNVSKTLQIKLNVQHTNQFNITPGIS